MRKNKNSKKKDMKNLDKIQKFNFYLNLCINMEYDEGNESLSLILDTVTYKKHSNIVIVVNMLFIHIFFSICLSYIWCHKFSILSFYFALPTLMLYV